MMHHLIPFFVSSILPFINTYLIGMEPGKCTQDEGIERPVLHNASHELGADKSVIDHENTHDDEQITATKFLFAALT